MPDSIRQADNNINGLLQRLQTFIDNEQDPKCRIILTNLQIIVEKMDDTNKIVDEQTIVLKRHNESIERFQRDSDRNQGMLSVIIWVIGILQVLIFSAGSYIFSNTSQMLKDNAVMVEKINGVDRLLVIHQEAQQNMLHEKLP